MLHHIYDIFSKFELELLPIEWVQQIWKDDFSETLEFPPHYEMFLEDADISGLMLSAAACIKDWLDTTDFIDQASTSASHNRSSLDNQVDTRSWQNLVANNIQHKPLISVLSVFILRGKTEKEFEERRLGVIATDLYLLLLTIPGSQVFHIFNPILYSHAIENFKICDILAISSVNSKPARKKKRGRRVEEDSDDEDEQSHPETDVEVQALSHSDKSTTIRLLSKIADDLLYVLKKHQLKDQDGSLLITIQISILLTRLERSSSSLLSTLPRENSISYIAYKAYKILLELCKNSHGDVQETVRLIMREIMSSFLIFDERGLNLAAREANVVKDHSLQFISNLLSDVRDPAFLGVLTLTEQVCAKIPDKADLRTKGVQVVLDILNVQPQNLYSRSVVSIMKFAHSDLVKYRMTALEIVTKLLLGQERTPTSPLRPFPQQGTHLTNGHAANDNDSDSDDNGIVLTQLPDYSTTKFLLGTMFSRCQDVASSVRAKALSILANLISSNNRCVRREMESIFVTPYLNAETIESANVYEKGFFDFHLFVKGLDKETNADIDPLPGAKAIISLLELFIVDEKVFVRKSAFQVLASIFLMNEKWMTNKYLELLVDNCKDRSVMVRKLLANCLTDLLMQYPSHRVLAKYWVLGVMPLLGDQEIKSQENVLRALQTIILDNLVPYRQMKTALHALPWLVLKLIGEHEKRTQFLFAFHKWMLSGTLKQSLVTTLKTHIDTENNVFVWYLLSCFSEYQDIQDPQFVVDYFYVNVFDSQQVGEYCCQLVTEVMHFSWRQLPPLIQINLCDSLLKHLSQFVVPLPMIARCIDICQLITEAHADSKEEGRARTIEWAANLIMMCESRLEKVIGVTSPVIVEDELRLTQYIFTLGDTAQICPGEVKRSTILLLHNLLIGEPDPDEDKDKFEGCFTKGRWKGVVSACVQGVTVATLGKLCLQKEETAGLMVPLFGSLLSKTPHPEIKINAMIALSDMCIKFTSMVETHLPQMCLGLRDRELKVRQNTLKLIIRLLQEDYLKARNGSIVFHLLTMINDENDDIKDTVKSYFINSLLVKYKALFVNEFVKVVLHYNGYDIQSAYEEGSKMSERERLLFCLEGSEKEEQRMNIYKFMLETMYDDDRFNVTNLLCIHVLAGVAKETIELSSSGTSVLQDTLHVLSCEEIRLSTMKAGSKDNEEEEDEMAIYAKAVNSVARQALVSQVLKRNMVEHVVPIFIRLKHKLKQMKSPLVRDLMTSLRHLMKDYKTEIDEILAADEELAAEIHHDLRNLDEEQEGSEYENEDDVQSGDVLKQALMEVVKLNEARMSMIVTERGSRSKRSSVSSSVSHRSNKSSKSPYRSPSQPSSSRTSPGSNVVSSTKSPNRSLSQSSSQGSSRVSHAFDSQPGPSGVKFSPSSSKTSPVSNGQPRSNRTSPATQRSSPGSSDLSPGIDRGPPSPSNSSSKSESSRALEERRSLLRPRGDRNSTASSNSGCSTKSRNKKTTKKKKK